MWDVIIKKLKFFFRQWHDLLEQMSRHWRLSKKASLIRGRCRGTRQKGNY